MAKHFRFDQGIFKFVRNAIFSQQGTLTNIGKIVSELQNVTEKKIQYLAQY